MLIQEYLQLASKNDLTIISSSCYSADFLNLNLLLAKALNPTKKIFWIIIQNTPILDRNLDNEKLSSEFIRIDGPIITEEENKNIAYGSFQHAKAINIAQSYVHTNLFLVLDPDCFILECEWIMHMQKLIEINNYAFFGAPYHPERLNFFNIFGRIYENFPCAICLFVNKKILQVNDIYNLDFTPPVRGKFNNRSYQNFLKQKLKKITNEKGSIKALKFIAFCITHNPKMIWQTLRMGNYSWVYDPRVDIGFKVYKNFNNKFFYSTLKTYYAKEMPLFIKILRFFKIYLFKGYPRVSSDWVKHPHELVDSSLISQGRWEQFFLNQKLFCIHLGKISYAGTSSDLLEMKKFLGRYLEKDINAQISTLIVED